MAIDRARFFKIIRETLFDHRMSKEQVAGIEALLNRWEQRDGPVDLRQLAYMLATVHHETARRMQPVRETLASSDTKAIAILEDAFARGRLATVGVPYWRRDPEGKSWLGRGLVQLTHRANYARMAVLTGIDLTAEPHRAMEPPIAIAILFEGMAKGAFTGHKLEDYFCGKKADWTGARQIINGRDRAALVAWYAKQYLAALRAG